MSRPSESTTESVVERALGGDRLAVAKLISIVEDGAPELGDVIRAIFPHTGKAYTVGLTGAPGAGKSTLTESLVGQVRDENLQVGVLAVDPSSPFTGGALLGDRVRMQSRATDPGVFIRSMATRGHLGGLSLATPEAVRILDAAGFAYVLIETVGVGQAEVEIAEAADTTVVVVTPGWGDSVQVGKAGVLEIADVFVVNKSDRAGAREAVRDLNQMIDFGVKTSWRPPVLETVATDGKGIGPLWVAVKSHRKHLESSGELKTRRAGRIRRELSEIVAERVRSKIATQARSELDEQVKRVERREIDPYEAAEELLGKLG